jgi:hypothetical protein
MASGIAALAAVGVAAVFVWMCLCCISRRRHTDLVEEQKALLPKSEKSDVEYFKGYEQDTQHPEESPGDPSGSSAEQPSRYLINSSQNSQAGVRKNMSSLGVDAQLEPMLQTLGLASSPKKRERTLSASRSEPCLAPT